MDVDRKTIDEPDGGTGSQSSPANFKAEVSAQVRPAILSVLVLTALSGVIFPLLLYAIARPLFPHQAAGSLILRGGTVVGSELIGQEFQRPEYFQPRPSAAGSGYDGRASGGSNLGPNNPRLLVGSSDFAGIRQLSEAYRESNGLTSDVPIPIDAVTRSGSGLDPHISLANALLQVPRVARARRRSEASIRLLVMNQLEGRQFGFLGSPRVSLLPLNMALDKSSGDRAIR